ncbi:MAG: peptide chain release factor N(5)-glutamine methyltransferase [Endomicrobiales bacterium]|jgi:release factor glutamine methyltransferase|nr:peptide chain release factor N(5)-glutamine methyltransferase [Endomicrobiales bacterium]
MKNKTDKRLNAVEPLEYVRGFTQFLGCKIDLSKRPLIPRPETEFWVKKAINYIKSNNHNHSRSRTIVILDIFSGSGCIGLAILKHIKNAEVFFADIEDRGVGHKTIKSDVFSNIKNKFDFIFANPPYIPTKNKSLVQKSVLDFEPHKALFAKQDGLFYIRKFLKQAKNHLNYNGIIFMEFDFPQKEEIKKMSEKFGYKTCKFYKDQYGKYRWVVIK